MPSTTKRKRKPASTQTAHDRERIAVRAALKRTHAREAAIARLARQLERRVLETDAFLDALRMMLEGRLSALQAARIDGVRTETADASR